MTPARQIALPLAWPAGDDRFLVTPSNADAARVLAGWRDWPVPAGLLVGPPRSGRSLLARLWAARGGGAVIDDAPGAAEEALFHAWNRAVAGGAPLLLVADPGWTPALPDLRSRLAAGARAAIGPPDDALLRALLEAAFLARGADARPALLDWLAGRLERSHAAAERAAALLATAAAEQRRRLSVPLARAALADAGLLAPEPPPREFPPAEPA